MGWLGDALGRLGSALGVVWGVLERCERRLGNVLGGVMGHLRPSRGVLAPRLERPQPDFGTKLRHSVWDAILYSIFISFGLVLLCNLNT